MTRYDFGARLQEDGTTQFRFWAPDVDAVAVEIVGQATPMRRDEDGVFSATLEAPAGTRYRYRVSPELAVPDPASRMQAGDVHDDSIVVDPAFSWEYPDWRGRPWAETVVYELHAGACGGFAGIAADLPRLAALGVTAIELMPIADFPGARNWGYDGVLPYAPDTAYGTPDALKSCIDAAHGLGLQVFLDVVYNHFGPDGNYLNAYAKSFFREDKHTPWGNAIDFRRPQVKQFFIENALYWLEEFRFDGLRFDAVHAIEDPGFLRELAAAIRAAMPAGRHVHLILENEENDASLLRATLAEQTFDAQWTDDWHHCAHVLLTGESEGYYGDFRDPAAQMARCLAEGFAYQGEASAHAEGAARGTPSGHLPTTAFVICLQNHDQIGNRAMGGRLRALAEPEALRAAVALLLLTPQIPMLFMGEEWGSAKPFLFFTDHHDELGRLVTEGRRKEFAHFAAFSNAETRARIPDPNAAATFEASIARPPAAPDAEQRGWLELYRNCLAVRRDQIVPRLAGCSAIGAQAIGEKAVRAAWAMNDGATLTLAANFGAAQVPCKPGSATLLFASSGTPFENGELPGFTTCAWLNP
jgi:maltooligosyltrehalose trehalohydrolase